jgi:hypothetical protein
MSGCNRHRVAGFGGLVAAALLLATPAATQIVGKTEQTNGEQQTGHSPQGERHSGISLACEPSSNAHNYTCYRDSPHDPPTLREKFGRFGHRFIRDPIAILTLALFLIGGWQVEISRRTAKRQLRAYVFADHVGISDGTHLKPPIFQLGIPRTVIAIKNSGQTPAYGLRHWGGIEIKRLTEERTLVPPENMTDGSLSSIPTGGLNTKVAWFTRKLTTHEISEIKTCVSAMYVYGRIEYLDVFKRRHFTNYRLRHTGSWPPAADALLNFCDEGNDAN